MTKQVLANVDIPIKINEDGKIESLHSYAQIEIIKQTWEVPEKYDNIVPLYTGKILKWKYNSI